MLYTNIALLLALSQAPPLDKGGLPNGAKGLLDSPFPDVWQGWVDVDKQSRLKPSEIEFERKKSTSKIATNWQVKDRTLFFDGAGRNIETLEKFKDFDLWMEWKIPPYGDFALFLRGVPGPRFYDFHRFPEEIDKLGSGGLFLNRQFTPKPAIKGDLPIGEWNKTRVRMRSDRVSVWLNGKSVVDEIPLENSWDRRKPLPLEGPIGIQARGTRFEIRGLAILPIQTP